MSSIEKKKIGLALLSLILGVAVIIPPIWVLCSPITIICGLKALKRVKEDSDAYGGKTMATIGVIGGSLGLISFVVLIFAIGIPGVLRHKHLKETGQVRHEITAVYDAVELYHEENGSFPYEVDDLIDAGFLEKGVVNKSLGYYIDIISEDEKYHIYADKTRKGVLNFTFCMVEDGVFRVDEEGKSIDEYDYCKALPDYWVK